MAATLMAQRTRWPMSNLLFDIDTLTPNHVYLMLIDSQSRRRLPCCAARRDDILFGYGYGYGWHGRHTTNALLDRALSEC